MATALFVIFALGVAVDLMVRIVVYSKTKNPDVKHRHFWWRCKE